MKICITCDCHNIGKRKTLECGPRDVFSLSLFFRFKMALALKCSQKVAFSALRVLELLQQKDDSNDSMSRGEESDLFRQL